jgi:hypothetical protein
VGEACSTHRRDEKCEPFNILVGKPEGRGEHIGNIGVHRKIILK